MCEDMNRKLNSQDAPGLAKTKNQVILVQGRAIENLGFYRIGSRSSTETQIGRANSAAASRFTASARDRALKLSDRRPAVQQRIQVLPHRLAIEHLNISMALNRNRRMMVLPHRLAIEH